MRNWKAFPTRKRWGRVFKPHLVETWPTVQAAVELADPAFVAGQDTPREFGRCFDIARPPSKTCARAYQMFGYCHLVAAYMLELAQRALPEHEWTVLNAEAHSVVVAWDVRWVIDLNNEWGGHSLSAPRKAVVDAPADLAYFYAHVLGSADGFDVYSDVGQYLDHLREQDWRPPHVIARCEQAEAAARGL